MAVAGLILFLGAEFFVSQFTDNLEAIYHGAIYLKVAALIAPVYPVFFITQLSFRHLRSQLQSLLEYSKVNCISFLITMVCN